MGNNFNLCLKVTRGSKLPFFTVLNPFLPGSRSVTNFFRSWIRISIKMIGILHTTLEDTSPYAASTALHHYTLLAKNQQNSAFGQSKLIQVIILNQWHIHRTENWMKLNSKVHNWYRTVSDLGVGPGLEEVCYLGPVPAVEPLPQQDQPLLHLLPRTVTDVVPQAVHVPLVTLVLTTPAVKRDCVSRDFPVLQS